MKITVEITTEELDEMNFDETELIEHIISTLDGGDKELAGYNFYINVTE